MADYKSFGDVANSEEFKEFVRAHFGREVSAIKDFEEEAFYKRFLTYRGEMKDEEKGLWNEVLKQADENMADKTKRQVYLDTYFPQKEWENLPADDKAFLAVIENSVIEKKNENSAEIVFALTAEDVREFMIEQGMLENGDAKEKNAALTNDSPEYSFNSNEDVYEAFHELADKNQLQSDENAVRKFQAAKWAYLADKTPEQQDEVNNQLNRFINNEDQEKMIYGNELYTVNEEFRSIYNNIDAEMKSRIAAPVVQNRDNTKENAGENETGKAPLGIMLTDDNSRQKEAPAKILPSDEKSAAEYDEVRLRSLNSDDNEFLIDQVRLSTLHDMGVVSDEEAADLTPQKAIEVLNKHLPDMSDKQLKQMESLMTDKMLESEKLFAIVPPSVLAAKYDELSKGIAKEKDEQKKAELQAKKNTVAARIDQLADMLVNQGQSQDNLYFADTTNIADVYEGYGEMFAVRNRDLKELAAKSQDDAEKQVIQELQNKMYAGIGLLKQEMDSYDQEHSLDKASPKDAEKIEKNFDKLNKALETVQPDEETLALVSNFKFLDETGKPKPQFVNEQGEVSDVYRNGDKIIEGSELDTAIRLAKQNIVQDNMVTGSGLDAENLQEYLTKELSERLPENLYALHISDEVVRTGVEDPQAFTDKTKLNEFVNKLANPERPMAISAAGFDRGVDYQINATAGFANALGMKIGKDKPVIGKIFEPLKDIDKRAADRMNGAPSKRKTRIEMLKRAAKGFTSAFVVSAGITALSTMGASAAADAGITAGTMGMNKLIGMGIGSALAIGMTIKQFRSRRKQLKKEGKPAGFLSVLKDRKFAMTAITTAMGAAALGFAATGNPGTAQALGMGALAVGTANGIISNYNDSRKGGLGKMESVGWAALQALANAGGALTGRGVANAGIDAYNQHNPQNEVFQHKEVVGHETVHNQETVLKEEAVEGFKDRATMWRGEEAQVMHDKLVEAGVPSDKAWAYVGSHDTIVHDGGGNVIHEAAATHTGHDFSPQEITTKDVQNHVLWGDEALKTAGLDADTQAKAGSLINYSTGEVHVTPENLAAADEFLKHYNADGSIMHVDSTPHISGAGLDNANYNADTGHLEGGTKDGGTNTFSSYHDGDGITHVIDKTSTVDKVGMVKNDNGGAGLGMFGVLGNILPKTFKKRAGALLDRILRRGYKGENVGKRDKTSAITQQNKNDALKAQENKNDALKAQENKNDALKAQENKSEKKPLHISIEAEDNKTAMTKTQQKVEASKALPQVASADASDDGKNAAENKTLKITIKAKDKGR